MEFKVGEIYEDKWDKYIFLGYRNDRKHYGFIFRIEIKEGGNDIIDSYSIESINECLENYKQCLK